MTAFLTTINFPALAKASFFFCAPRRSLYHSPAFDPFAPFQESYGFSGVDFPLSDIGSGHAAYSRAMGRSNSIAFYRGHLSLVNITPHTLNRMRKTRRRLFYVTHYCTIARGGQRYTIELMWPVWVGKAPRGVLTQALPGWNNPFRKGEWQEFHVAEFAFVNLRYLWPYDHSWERLDINRSPLAPEEMKTWWKENFLPAVKIRAEDTFGYSVFRFTEGYHQSPAYIPPMAEAGENLLAPETDRYKAAMGAVAAQASEVPEHYWWIDYEAKTLPFIRKWEPLGLGVEPALETQLTGLLPDGQPMDPSGENVARFFDKAIDPASYYLRCEIPPATGTLVEEVRKNYDGEMDVTPVKHIHQVGEDLIWQENPRDFRFKKLVESENTNRRYYDVDSSGVPYNPYDYDSWITEPKNQRIMDGIIKSQIENIIQTGRQHLPLTMKQERQTRARLLRDYRAQLGVIPETGPATEDNQEDHLDIDLPSAEEEWSSDEEVNYSASWIKWGNAREFNYHGDPSQDVESDIADDLLEDWAVVLQKERGSADDELEFGEFKDYEPTPEVPHEVPCKPTFLRWTNIRDFWAPFMPAGVDAFHKVVKNKANEEFPTKTPRDPRHEE